MTSRPKIYVGGAGGAPANNFIRSLREAAPDYYIIGASCVFTDLFLADAEEKHIVLPATHANYTAQILRLLGQVRPAFIHLQHDFEVRAISRLRRQVHDLGVKTYLPSVEAVENCVDKNKSYEIWQRASLRVPQTILLCTPADLRKAFDTLGATIWLRATEGGGGKGAVPTNNFDFAQQWIERFNGWGDFTASELLTERSVTWLSLWYEGELVVAQSRRRLSWNFGDRTLSGVTGITGVAETVADETVDRVAQDAIRAIDARPHGIWGVDMTYDQDGLPNPTEINIGRFFTTHYFFTKAGLNLPEIYCNIALKGEFPALERKINPLPAGLVWIRGMDRQPILTTISELREAEQKWTLYQAAPSS